VKNGEGGAIVRYGEIEKALASLHGVTEQSSGIFRGRLRHFQKLGIVPSSPGRGAKIDYDLKAAVDWAVAFDLAELGIQPELIKSLIQIYGVTIFTFFQSPSSSNEDILFCFDAAFLTTHMNRQSARLDLMKSGMFDSRISGLKPVSMLPWFFYENAHVRRVSAINLSRLKRELGKALGIEWGPMLSYIDPDPLKCRNHVACARLRFL
jgi:hypothetical protein